MYIVKRILSLCLCFMIILAACPVHAAGAGDDIKWLIKFETLTDVTTSFYQKDIGSFNSNTYLGTGTLVTNNNTTDNKQSEDPNPLTRLSKFSVCWANPGGAPNFHHKFPAPVDTTGYTHVNFWMYTRDTFTTLFYLHNTDKYKATYIGFKKGWNLISVPLGAGGFDAAADLKTITGMRLHIKDVSNIIPDGLPGAGTGLQYQETPGVANAYAHRAYFDSMWLSKGEPVNNFSSYNIADGYQYVNHTTSSVKFNAPGLVESSINVNNIKVSYCAEGTHNESSHSDTFLTSGTDFTASYETDKLSVNFTNDLIPGTSYKIAIDGADFIGSMYCSFNDFTLNFRTKGLDENFPPEVTLISPVANERFYPGDNINIKAAASDADGTITKVEFYADDVLLGEDSVPSDGYYEFLWENVPENMSGYNIKLRAYDNKSVYTETLPVNISVLGIKDPFVTFVNPAENISIVRNFSGITTSTDVEAEVNVTCYGATVVKAEFLLNGDVVKTFTDAKESYTYTYANLPIGNHTLSVMVTDTEGSVGVSETRTVNVCDYGKKLPALAEYNFEDVEDGSETDWTKTGTASFLVETKAQNNALKIETANPASAESVSVQKRYRTSLSATPWEITAKIMLGDILHDRTYTLSGSAEDASITFKAGGDITVGGTKKGTYKENEWIEVRYIVNPQTKTSYCLVNDVKVYEKEGLSTVFSSNGATIKLSQTGIPGKTGWCKIDDVAVCKLSQTELDITGIKVCSSQGADLGDSAVTSDASYISVSLNETLNNESIKNNIIVTDTSTNNRISLIYKDGKAYFNEVLKSNTTYNVLVTTSVSSQNGTSLAKGVSHSFTTASDDIELSNTGFSESALSAGVTSVTFDFELDNNASEPKTVYAVAVVYDGGKQKALSVKKVDLASSAQDVASSVTLPVTYTNNTFIEVYFVDDMQTMNPISSTIYKLK